MQTRRPVGGALVRALIFLAGIGVLGAGASAPSAAKPALLIDHLGKVLPSSNTYAIWWGPREDFPADAPFVMENIFRGLYDPARDEPSGYLAIANEYLRGETAATAFKGSLHDESAPPSKQPSVATIVAEVAKILEDNDLKPDSNGIYFVYTSNFVSGGTCAWHASGTIGGTTVQVAYLPNASGVKACDAGMPFNGYTEGARAVAHATVHELMAAITDPLGNGWRDKNGAEMGRKCNVTTGLVTLTNNFVFPLPPAWSNAAGRCVLAADGL